MTAWQAAVFVGRYSRQLGRTARMASLEVAQLEWIDALIWDEMDDASLTVDIRPWKQAARAWP